MAKLLVALHLNDNGEFHDNHLNQKKHSSDKLWQIWWWRFAKTQ
jgi:hypothetical protein